MTRIFVALVITYMIIACTIIIGSNTTNIDRDSGIILENENETNANEEN